MAQLLTYEDIKATLSRLSSTSGISLRPGLGVFLDRPRLWDPEAEGGGSSSTSTLSAMISRTASRTLSEKPGSGGEGPAEAG